ncbi:DUF1003 domain-containing protein [Chelatococcus reniformis]|uniref:DUF1003 domain-containing protein n=1 Tax=Chelatococcus reniformis TaxID=1494448 RepID=A0A916UQ90_9HYPH|nr:DUF1003 domain-containing protein [Chelatococcus reniformis]GGC83015.1 hypothetical protein GCM10010994_46130 [Chelatococcus reniformis]
MPDQAMPNSAEDPSAGLTYPSAASHKLAPVLNRNIEALRERAAREQKAATWSERTADAVTRFAGSMAFVYLHLLIFGSWIGLNLRIIPGIRPWDESFVVLAMVASVEAIFLSTFVLISQNRMAAVADKRADLDLQISLLAEHELTKMATLLSDVAEHLKVRTSVLGELEEVKRDVAPEAVLDRIEKK